MIRPLNVWEMQAPRPQGRVKGVATVGEAIQFKTRIFTMQLRVVSLGVAPLEDSEAIWLSEGRTLCLTTQ